METVKAAGVVGKVYKTEHGSIEAQITTSNHPYGNPNARGWLQKDSETRVRVRAEPDSRWSMDWVEDPS